MGQNTTYTCDKCKKQKKPEKLVRFEAIYLDRGMQYPSRFDLCIDCRHDVIRFIQNNGKS